MSTPQSTPVRHAKLGISSTKSLPLANEYKKLLSDQHQRLNLKHQQDLDLIDDVRSYIKARLSIEKDYTSALNKLAKQHSNHIGKKFALFHQLEAASKRDTHQYDGSRGDHQDDQAQRSKRRLLGGSNKQLDSSNNQNSPTNANSGSNTNCSNNFDVPESPCSLYKVWSEHINRLQVTSKSRSDQFEQLALIVDKLKDIRTHKAQVGKKCLDTHLKRIQEDLLVSMVDLERARKLYYEDESQAKKARENEEKIKKKRSGLLTKFTDLQAKKEKSSAQREANDIQSTQARNDYIMALAAANAHLDYYYQRDLNDFIHIIDDGVLDHCKIFMATLSECDINSLKDSLSHAQFWSKLIAITGSQQTNGIFLECEQSQCLKGKRRPLEFEPCNNDPINKISLEHNADYALQHEIDKWFTWFKKECRNLGHLIHQLETCRNALADGKKSIELNGHTIEDLEPKIIELKQQIRKCEAAKLKAQARLKVIKEGGMPIEEWSAVESEIVACMARTQEEQERTRRMRELKQASGSGSGGGVNEQSNLPDEPSKSSGGQAAGGDRMLELQVSHDSDADSEAAAVAGGGAVTPGAADESMHNLASVSRSTTGYLIQKQQNAISGYSALADPSLVWQDDYSAAGVWGGGSNATTLQAPPQASAPDAVVVTTSEDALPGESGGGAVQRRQQGYDLLGAHDQDGNKQSSNGAGQQQANSMSIQSSSPLSAIVANSNGQHLAQSPYQIGMMSEAYKSDYECDYTLTGGQQQSRLMHSSASSAGPHHGMRLAEAGEQAQQEQPVQPDDSDAQQSRQQASSDVQSMLNRRVVAMYAFEKSNEDDLAFQEDDVLLVIGINQGDTNWVRARNVLTGEEGYAPSSYIRLQDDRTSAEPDAGFEREHERQRSDFEALDEASGEADEPQGAQAQTSSANYCRALYDYQPPDSDAVEEDGLPHFSLQQGELMRIVDQGEHDGWWLVEKSDGALGHVPSMLVSELDEDQPDKEGDNESELDEGSGDLTSDDIQAPDQALPPPPPSTEAPVLSDPGEEAAAESKSHSLMPTSFIIIEPTPEVESKRFVCEDDGAGEEGSSGRGIRVEEIEGDEQTVDSQRPQVGTRQTKMPSSDVSYSVIDEDFVLERPTRKPYSGSASEAHHEPTIEEENSADVVTDKSEPRSTQQSEQQDDDEQDYPSVMPAISVVIDTVEAIPRSPDDSFDRDDDSEADYRGVQGGEQQDAAAGSSEALDEQSSSEKQQLRHTGNVDCSPILRHHAEEFSRMIIEEALMLAPGSSVGPSTSSASINHDNYLEHGYSDDE